MSTSLRMRSLTPEWLDSLPAEDPRARHARRDLVLVNALMGNAAAMRAALRAMRFTRIAELGAGSGHVLAKVASTLPANANVQATLVDLHPCVDAPAMRRFERAGWRVRAVAADALAWLEREPDERCDVIVANLFLHHLEEDALRALFALAARKARAFVACEPRRSRFAECAARLLPLLGCNGVTRHDAVVSVRAGFRARELSTLWPADGAWRCDERRWGPFTHRFVAARA